MGNSRKNKPPSHQRKNSLSSPSSHNTHHLAAYEVQTEEARDEYEYDGELLEDPARSLDFSQVLQDAEGSLVGTMTGSVIAISGLVGNPSPDGSSFRVSWKEMMYLILVVTILAGLSIFMGVAAGITISIHYFDTRGNPSLSGIGFRERRVTNLDQIILSTNIMNPPGDSSEDREPELTLGRVMTINEAGQRDFLLVVEETSQMQQPDNNDSFFQKAQPNNYQGRDDLNLLYDGRYKPYRHKGPPNVNLSASKVHPTICPDGSIGFQNWETFKAAIDEANALSAEKFMKWNEYFASLPEGINSSNWYTVLNPQKPQYEKEKDAIFLYYDQDVFFSICPGTVLNSKGTIFINSPNIIIECGNSEEYEYQLAAKRPSVTYGSSSKDWPACTLQGSGTHLSFGPHARNIIVRGLVFRSARTSSLTFHYDGALASFEDCVWTDNYGPNGKYGSVADVNTTSNVNFFRCEIGIQSTSGPSAQKVGNSDPVQGNVAAYGGLAPGFASFLSLRN